MATLSCRSCRPNAPFAELVAALANKHRRRNARGASAASAWRIEERGRQSLAARYLTFVAGVNPHPCAPAQPQTVMKIVTTL
jgi:hypothetical protein